MLIMLLAKMIVTSSCYPLSFASAASVNILPHCATIYFPLSLSGLVLSLSAFWNIKASRDLLICSCAVCLIRLHNFLYHFRWKEKRISTIFKYDHYHHYRQRGSVVIIVIITYALLLCMLIKYLWCI